MFLKKRKVKKLIARGYDLPFISRIQPQGNIDFKSDDRYWKSGDGYHATLFVTGYPTGGLNDYWGTELMQVQGTRAFMHVTHLDNKLVQEKASKAVEEKSSRIDENQKATKNQAELDEVQDLMLLEQDIRHNNSGVKGIWTRIYASGNTEKELFEKMSEIKNGAPKFSMTSFIGEQDIEYHSPFVPPLRQKDLPNHRQPQPVPVRDLSGGYWFNHTKLADPHGTYFGYTPTSGAVNLDFLQNDDIRTRPFMFVAGAPKMYQKKFVLKHTDSLYARGHKIINIDLDGTFHDLTKFQYGKVLSMSGGANKINIMQVLPTMTKENGVEVDEIGSFRLHVAKLKSIAQVLNQEITSDDLLRLEDLITDFYVSIGLWQHNAEKNAEKIHITTIVNDEHPRLSQFCSFLEQRYRAAGKAGNDHDTRSVGRISKTFSSLIKNYGPIFDVYTNFEDLSEEQVVTIDLSELTKTPMLLNLQLTQVLSLISSYVVNNGKIQRQKRKQNLSLTHDQLTHYVINISSAQMVLDIRYSQSVTFLADMIEEMGTNYAGVVLEMSSLQNVLVASGNTTLDIYASSIRRIFSLMQYRVFANTDETTVHLLADALRESMTESELETLPNLVQGQLFLNIAGHGNVVFNQEFLGNELERYASVD